MSTSLGDAEGGTSESPQECNSTTTTSISSATTAPVIKENGEQSALEQLRDRSQARPRSLSASRLREAVQDAFHLRERQNASVTLGLHTQLDSESLFPSSSARSAFKESLQAATKTSRCVTDVTKHISTSARAAAQLARQLRASSAALDSESASVVVEIANSLQKEHALHVRASEELRQQVVKLEDVASMEHDMYRRVKSQWQDAEICAANAAARLEAANRKVLSNFDKMPAETIRKRGIAFNPFASKHVDTQSTAAAVSNAADTGNESLRESVKAALAHTRVGLVARRAIAKVDAAISNILYSYALHMHDYHARCAEELQRVLPQTERLYKSLGTDAIELQHRAREDRVRSQMAAVHTEAKRDFLASVLSLVGGAAGVPRTATEEYQADMLPTAPPLLDASGALADSNEVMDAIALVLVEAGTMGRVFGVCARAALRDCSSRSSIFRGNSAATRLFTACARNQDAAFLHAVVRPTIQRLGDWLAAEVDAARAEASAANGDRPASASPASISTAIAKKGAPDQLTAQLVDDFFQRIRKHMNQLSPHLAQLLHLAVEEGERDFPASGAVVVSSLLFLRFLVPALSSPKAHGCVSAAASKLMHGVDAKYSYTDLLLICLPVARLVQLCVNEPVGQDEAHPLAALFAKVEPNARAVQEFFQAGHRRPSSTDPSVKTTNTTPLKSQERSYDGQGTRKMEGEQNAPTESLRARCANAEDAARNENDHSRSEDSSTSSAGSHRLQSHGLQSCSATVSTADGAQDTAVQKGAGSVSESYPLQTAEPTVHGQGRSEGWPAASLVRRVATLVSMFRARVDALCETLVAMNEQETMSDLILILQRASVLSDTFLQDDQSNQARYLS